MWKHLGLLMKQQIRYPCFGSTLKVCVAFIILTSASSLACYYGGGGGGRDDDSSDDAWAAYMNGTRNQTITVVDLDAPLVVNITGVTDPLERNIKTAWRGWEPSDETKNEWREWHEKWKKENEKNDRNRQSKKKKGKGGYDGKKGKGGQDGKKGGGGGGGGDGEFSDDESGESMPEYPERGPGSSWPDIPGWSELGFGSDGAPVPPWGFAPRNVGKPSLCFVPPLRGTCRDANKQPETRWGYNPYMDDCQKYEYSGCGGTRNRFVTKKACTRHCANLPVKSCSVNSGIKDTSKRT